MDSKNIDSLYPISISHESNIVIILNFLKLETFSIKGINFDSYNMHFSLICKRAPACIGQPSWIDENFDYWQNPQKRPSVIQCRFSKLLVLGRDANFRFSCSTPKIAISSRILRRITDVQPNGERPWLQYPTVYERLER